MYILTKSDLKILRFIKRHPYGVSRSAIFNKFHCDSKQLDTLNSLGYIYHDYELPRDKDGFPVGDIPGTALYTLGHPGIIEVETHQWFNLQYVVTQILVPIVIALCTYALTYFLQSYF